MAIKSLKRIIGMPDSLPHNKNEQDWKQTLTPGQYAVMREQGTETPFSGKYVHTQEAGMYTCAACGAELFSSDAKFDSGTGWPSFTQPANRENIELREDTSLGMSRVEVRCKRCGSHLGHVFNDLPRIAGKAGGPRNKGGERYCINSCALDLHPHDQTRP